MSESLGDAVLELRTDGSKYFSDLNKAKSGAVDLDSAFKKTGSGFLDVGSKISMMALGIIQAFSMLNNALKSYTKAYIDQIDAEAKRNQILKQTGNIVNKTSSELNDMASAMQKLNGTGDELIINAQAIMMTFKKVGEDIFPRTMSAVLDLSAAFKMDLQSATVMLGKALEDPIRGMGALRKVGVTFSEEAEKMAKSLWEMGDVAGAQKIILKGVEDQVKGVAEAMGKTAPGRIRIFAAAFGDLQEAVGGIFVKLQAVGATAFTPIIENLTKWFNENSNKIVNFFLNLPEIVGIVFSKIGGIIREAFTGGTFKKVIMAMSEIIIAGLGAAFSSIGDLLGALIKSLPDIFVLMAAQVANLVKNVATAALVPEEFKGEILDLGEWMRSTGRKYDISQPTERMAAQAGYDNYVKEWKKYNAESARMDAEIADLTGKALDKIGNNIAPALGKMGERFDTFLQKGGENLKEVGKAVTDLFSQGEGKSMMDQIALVLGRDNPILKSIELNTGSTADNTGDIADNTNPATEKQKTKIGLTVVPTMTTEEGGKKYGGMGVSQTGSIGVGGIKEWGKEPTIWEKLGGIIEPIINAFGGFANGMFSAIGSLSSFQAVLNPLKTIFDSMLRVLQPIIDSMLQPIVGALSILGQTLGAVVIPILQIFSPVLKALAEGFIWLYNKAIMPLANAIIWVFNLIHNVVATIWNGIASAINALLGWAGVKLKKMAYVNMESGFLSEINTKDLTAAGSAATGTGSGGAGATYEAARPITVKVNVYDNQVFGGSIRDFALIIRKELEALEVLNL